MRQDGQPSGLGKEGSVADPHILAEGLEIRGLVALGVPYPGLATSEPLLSILQSVWCRHRVRIVKVSQQHFIASNPALD